MVDVDEHLRRLAALLRPSRAGVSLREREADPPAEALGALAGVGLETADADVAVSVYVFDGQESLDAAARTLREREGGDGSSRIGQNGPMLFYGRANAAGAGEAAAGKLSRLASAFAGDE